MKTVATAVAFVSNLIANDAGVLAIKPERCTKYLAQFQTTVAEAEAGVAAGVIANARFIEIKFDVTRAIERARNAAEVYDFCDLHHIKGKIGKKDTSEGFRAFLVEVLPLATLIVDQLKPLAKKRQPKPVEDRRNHYLAPRAGNDAKALVQRALVQVTLDTYDAVYQYILDDSTRRAKKFYEFSDAEKKAHPTHRPHDIFRAYFADRSNQQSRALIQELEDLKTSAERTKKIAELTKRDADFIRDQFVIKNLVKLDSIVEAKSNFKTIEIVGHTVSLWSLEGSFILRFTDSSHFTVSNSVVRSYSVYGKPFQRFPLTFHDVVLADGSKLSRPSEERVNTLFCGKSA